MSDPVKPSEQKESPYTRALGDISQAKWDMYQRELRPVENQFMARVDAMNDPAQADRAAGLAQAEVMRQYAPVVEEAKAGLMQAGVSPNSGRAIVEMGKTYGVGATAAGQAAFGGRTGQKDRYVAGLESINNIGNGQAALAQNSMSEVAEQSVEAAKRRTAQQWGERAAMVQGVGSMAGALARTGLTARG